VDFIQPVLKMFWRTSAKKADLETFFSRAMAPFQIKREDLDTFLWCCYSPEDGKTLGQRAFKILEKMEGGPSAKEFSLVSLSLSSESDPGL